ncbi:hypothetical protein FX988_04225 [Paraglaciecola mesophila]|uniref:Uncharacterized protein n=1 Tax=Paraglaciecola mesophila TaxID=197222 RepID=A0A857JTA8_9ALTE|nr:hypothetical protein FX988_04225 [Paraglaciecola mesophila]
MPGFFKRTSKKNEFNLSVSENKDGHARQQPDD